MTMKHSVFALGLSILVLCMPLLMASARGENNAAEEALYRAEALRTLPRGAARRLFSVAMLTGHASHQLGLEVDIWLTPAPAKKILTIDEREDMPAIDVVQPDLLDVNAAFTPAQLALLRRAAQTPEVDRIFVNAAIKQAACRNTSGERAWLRKLRPWPGHSEHIHVALKCPNAGCAIRNPIPAGDGCGKELAHWFREDVRFPKKAAPPRKILRRNDLPKACRKMLAAP